MEICNKELCTGCGACYQECKHKAISMCQNEEGFLYPIINDALCKRCNLCKKICPINNKKNNNIDFKQKAYYFINTNKAELNASSSGGAFIELAKKIIENQGVVFGCAINGNNEVLHTFASSKDNLKIFQGSKYVQSNTKETFKKVEELLKKNIKILYTGTPCQIAGLRNYLKKDYKNLYTVDLICHGVPSPKIFNEYIKEIEKKYKSKITDIKFRDKYKKRKFYSLSFRLKDKKNKKVIIKDAKLSSFYYGFINDYFLRESCYSCQFTNINRVGDITIGDYWGIEKIHNGIENVEGISLVIINTKRGDELFKEVCSNNVYNKTDLEQAIKYNQNLMSATKKNQNIRDRIYKELNTEGYRYIEKKYLNTPHKLGIYIKIITPNFIKKIVKRVYKLA